MLHPVRTPNHQQTSLLHELLKIAVHSPSTDAPHPLTCATKYLFCRWVAFRLSDGFPNRLQLSRVPLPRLPVHCRSSAKEALTADGISAAAW